MRLFLGILKTSPPAACIMFTHSVWLYLVASDSGVMAFGPMLFTEAPECINILMMVGFPSRQNGLKKFKRV